MTRPAITTEDIADGIVRLPRTLRARSDVTIYDLAAQAGYFEQHEHVGESVIRQQLSVVPELVDEWLAFSEDKRVGSGWYFRMVPHRGYEVGYYGGVTAQHPSGVYADRFDACAKFIKEELETIRSW